MRNFDENTLTAEVLRRVRDAKDSRTREISDALIRHLHAFIREVRPTEAEWEAGIRFLTETGHACTATRQEFILLSDTLGVSMLVDAINHVVPNGATETTVFGPFYVEAPEFDLGADIRGDLPGPPMWVEGSVRSVDGRAIPGAVLDVWHSDHAGFYDLQSADQVPRLKGRGRFRTDSAGRFRLWTVRPASYPIPNDGPVGRMLNAQGRHPFRPEHIHFMISGAGHKKLVTHVFAEGDEYLDSDVVFGVKDSLVRQYKENDGGTAPDGRTMKGKWFHLSFDFVLASDAG